MLKKLPPILRNFYVVGGFIFLVWMTFLDSNDLISRFKLSSKLSAMEGQKEFYEKKIQEVQKDRNELLGNPKLMEKYAREKYLMKKEKEDIFIVEEQ